jgi:hypothetical protein
MQNPENYLSNMDNIFHQLRGHYLKINIERHADLYKNEKILSSSEKKSNSFPSNSMQKMQMKILEGRMKKLKYEKLRKKGDNMDTAAGGTITGGTEEDVKTNLQKYGSSVGYYTLENLLDKLKKNDAPEDDKKLLNWKELSEEEQKIKMREFMQQFKSDMEEPIWVEMSKDVFRNLKNITITWHKKSQKIVEIPNLVIHQSCFFWNFE